MFATTTCSRLQLSKLTAPASPRPKWGAGTSGKATTAGSQQGMSWNPPTWFIPKIQTWSFPILAPARKDQKSKLGVGTRKHGNPHPPPPPQKKRGKKKKNIGHKPIFLPRPPNQNPPARRQHSRFFEAGASRCIRSTAQATQVEPQVAKGWSSPGKSHPRPGAKATSLGHFFIFGPCSADVLLTSLCALFAQLFGGMVKWSGKPIYGSKKPVLKWNPGKWKHGPKPA